MAFILAGYDGIKFPIVAVSKDCIRRAGFVGIAHQLTSVRRQTVTQFLCLNDGGDLAITPQKCVVNPTTGKVVFSRTLEDESETFQSSGAEVWGLLARFSFESRWQRDPRRPFDAFAAEHLRLRLPEAPATQNCCHINLCGRSRLFLFSLADRRFPPGLYFAQKHVRRGRRISTGAGPRLGGGDGCGRRDDERGAVVRGLSVTLEWRGGRDFTRHPVRRNGEGGVSLDAWVWIPAFAGITKGAGMTEVGVTRWEPWSFRDTRFGYGGSCGFFGLLVLGAPLGFGGFGSGFLGFRGERFATRSVWGCSSVAWRAWPAVLVGESGRYSPGRFCCARSTSAGLANFVRHERVTPDQSRPALPFAGWRKAEFVLHRALSHVARGGVGTSQDGFVTHSSCGCSTSPPFLGGACDGASDRTLPRTERRRIEDTKRFRACQVGSTALCDCMTHGMPGGISDTGSDCVPFRGRPPFRAPSF